MVARVVKQYQDSRGNLAVCNIEEVLGAMGIEVED